MLIFGEDSTVLLQSAGFTDRLFEVLDQCKTVEELIETLQAHKRVTDVQVLDGETQVYSGRLTQGMVIKLFYDADSWMEYPIAETR
jgi:hypothetical protein